MRTERSDVPGDGTKLLVKRNANEKQHEEDQVTKSPLCGGAGLSVGAGFSDGLIPGPSSDPAVEVFDNFGFLGMSPNWINFGPGYVCADGTTASCNPDLSPENVVALCLDGGGPFGDDALIFRVNANPGSYALNCGTVPVNFDLNPPFSSVGQCISTLKAQRLRRLQRPGQGRLQPRPDRRLPRHVQRAEQPQSQLIVCPPSRGLIPGPDVRR